MKKLVEVEPGFFRWMRLRLFKKLRKYHHKYRVQRYLIHSFRKQQVWERNIK